MKSIQDLADEILKPEYRQPVKTIDEAFEAIGWEYVNRPNCCGSPVNIRIFLGAVDSAECSCCGRFVYRVLAPDFGNSWVSIPENFDHDDPKQWVSGQKVDESSNWGRQ